MNDPTPSQVFIYGGCTSRDTVQYYPPSELALLGYVARQSLISAFSAPSDPEGFDLARISGTFNQRMLMGDVRSSFPNKLRQAAADIDILVWDLMIERVGVHRSPSGGYVTRNGLPRLPGREPMGPAVIFGTDQHIDLWERALERFVQLLKQLSLFKRIVINATPWAVVGPDGRPARSTSTMNPEWFNREVSKYWELAEARGIRLARVEQSDAVADPNHKWGPAYFHYMPETYLAQLEALRRALSRDTPS